MRTEMKMNEITAEMPQQTCARFPYMLDIHVDHAGVNNFRRLTQGCDLIQILGLDEIAEDHVCLVIGCTDEATRNRLRDAW
jgi:hypothetical protein